MENIDDLMRQKFDSDDPGERFEFREEYWEQAQALLEKEEDKRRRRFWLFIGLVLAMALLAWLLLVQRPAGNLSQHKVGEQDSIFSTGKMEHSGNTDGKPTLSEQTIKSSGSKDQTKVGTNQRENMHVSENIAGFRTSKSVASTEASQQSLEGKNATINVGSTDQRQKEIPELDDQSTSPTITSPPITNPPITNHQSTSPPITNHQSTNPPITIPLTIIPTPLTPVALPERIFQPRKLPTVAKEPIAAKIKPVQDQGFSFGLSLAGAAYQQTQTLGPWAGWAVGAFGDYRLDKNWSLMLGLQARFVPGYAAPSDSSNPNQVEQLHYSFGFKSEQWKRETRGLHYLEVPLSAHWHKGPWGLEGGGAAGMLFLVQNRTEYTVESSLGGAKTTVKKFVKGDSEPYNRNYFSAFAGAEYRLSRRFSLMTRAQYRFTPVFKILGEGVKNDGLGNVELGLRVRLF